MGSTCCDVRSLDLAADEETSSLGFGGCRRKAVLAARIKGARWIGRAGGCGVWFSAYWQL